MAVKRRSVRLVDWLALTAVAFMSGGWLVKSQGWLDTTPYRDVRNIKAIAQSDGTVLVAAEYTLTDRACELLPPIMVFGWSFGNRVPLQYTPISQSSQTERLYAGHHLMRLSVNLNDMPSLPHLEVWTRHDCEGQIIERMMLEVDVASMPDSGCCP